MSEKIAARIRKLLELSHSSNENEAALAAAQAARLMSEHAIDEAMLRVSDEDDHENAHVSERIVEGNLPDDPKRRVAWRDRVSSAMAESLDCERFYWDNKMHVLGRESNVTTWRYTCAYLFAEIERLADEAWVREGRDLAMHGIRPRAWKSAFRLGAADTVGNKLYRDNQDRQERERTTAKSAVKLLGVTGDMALVRVNKALEVVAQDRAEVKAAYKVRTKGFVASKPIGDSTRYRSGYQAGREAGASIAINAARGALKS